ncbi:hypothetical protein EVAR_56741_1 [Eumeta japonica]|uniref:Uncharacterized protein n=1 Tax=Eumeta variegata TaxID=151549 RepID=A0A4C1ZU54_EUMVA|nr:hypothetical protein EVAR_56741_1 [Eumeta japonica]
MMTTKTYTVPSCPRPQLRAGVVATAVRWAGQYIATYRQLAREAESEFVTCPGTLFGAGHTTRRAVHGLMARRSRWSLS